MACYRQLDLVERQIIATLLFEKKSMAKIACRLSRSRSTVKREIERNGYRGEDGQWHYHHEVAEKKYKRRQARAGYGKKKFRSFYGRNDWLSLWTRTKFKKRTYIPNPFRFVPIFPWIPPMRNRSCTQLKDKRRYSREAEWSKHRKKYKDKRLKLPYFGWHLPKRTHRKKYLDWRWMYRFRNETEQKGRKSKWFWSITWKKDRRSNRYRPPVFKVLLFGRFRLAGRPQETQTFRPSLKKRKFQTPFTIAQKPENFCMASLCPEVSNPDCFSKNETSPGVDKSVLFLNPLIFSPKFLFSA